MNTFSSFFKHKVLSGLLLLLPVILIGYLLTKLWKALGAGIMKLSVFLGVDRLIGVASLIALTATAFILICFFAGVVAHFMSKRRKQSKFDNFLRMLPGYGYIQMMLEHRLRQKGSRVCVIVKMDDVWQPGFLIEKDEVCCIVYLPDSPNPAAGATIIIEDFERIRYVDITAIKLNNCIIHFGEGLADIYANCKKK